MEDHFNWKKFKRAAIGVSTGGTSEIARKVRHADELPSKTMMRQSLTMHNPNYIKSGADGKIYKRTGRVVTPQYVRPKGKVYKVPPVSEATGYDILEPFADVMSKKLKEKGLLPPNDLKAKAQLFYNNVVAAKAFNDSKPMNFEAYDHADPVVQDTVVANLLTYFRALNAGQQPNGQPLSTQDEKLSVDVKDVVQKLSGKVASAGLSPEDAADAGAALSNSSPIAHGKPFYKEPWFPWAAGAALLFIVFGTLKN